MEERAKALCEKIICLLSSSSTIDSSEFSIVFISFDNIVSSYSVLRECAYEFLNGFIWCMQYTGVIDVSKRSELCSELMDLALYVNGV